MNKKEFYTSPEVETFDVRFESVVCTSPKWGQQGGAGAEEDYNNYGPDF